MPSSPFAAFEQREFLLEQNLNSQSGSDDRAACPETARGRLFGEALAANVAPAAPA